IPLSTFRYQVLPMIRPELLSMLVCPENRAPLELATSDLLGVINRAVTLGEVVNKAGRKVDKQLDAGLVRADQTVLYPVFDEIPMMLIDESIPLDQPALKK